MSRALERILGGRLVGIIRLPDYSRSVEIAQALQAGALDVMEFTLTGAGALGAVRTVRAALGDAVCVGAGTVLDAEAAAHACDAGAQFLVTPALAPDVIAVGVARAVPVLCGALTPTEVLAAFRAGATLVKLFPAQLGGPSYLKALRGPFPQIPLVPTGGVGPDNARAYLDAGAAAVAMGGNLVAQADVAAGRFEAISIQARMAVEAVRRD
jgi:2-dehydro-3-deoxyphosphogluconate aldolase/(4S)-4-hydroxy-2-oxoglutarate aldolase